jgi:hypothetical protein
MKKLFFLLLSMPALCSAQIPADSAKFYYDSTVEVCGNVIDVTRDVSIVNGKPQNWLDLEFGTINGTKKSIMFTALIPVQELTPYSELEYMDAEVCITGKVIADYLEGYGKTPLITADSLAQVRYK